MTDFSEFAPTDIAYQGLRSEAERLQREEGLSPDEAMRVAASTMAGAGDNPQGTVESMQTCFDLEGKPVKGLTSDDIPVGRTDKFAKNIERRYRAAEIGVDEAERWLMEHDPNYGKTRTKKK